MAPAFIDWPRFWGQFSETIEKTNVTAITKFSYLRQLLDSKVRRTIEALPFTPECYNRAKNILTEKYGKESEIVKAYTREILELPSITNSNQKKISEFSEKLTYCVQALETLKKLEQVNGAVLMRLDKLPSIRGDLVRTDPDWIVGQKKPSRYSSTKRARTRTIIEKKYAPGQNLSYAL